MFNLKKNIASYYFRMLRFENWIGWLFNFTLGSILFAMPSITRFVVFFLSFIPSVAGIFVLNQYFDHKDDKLNKYKRNLPVSSGDILPKSAVLFSIFLFISGICLILLIDLSVIPLYLFSIALGVCYSAPPFRLKSRPIVDVIVAGIGSGVLPFIIGLQVSQQLTLDFSLPWIMRRYQDAFFCIIPIFFFHSASQILHAVGDYEADLKGNVHTFVVRYGKKTSINTVIFLLITTAILPIFYGFLNLSLIAFINWYLIIVILSIPGMLYIVNFLKDTSEGRINTLYLIFRKVSPIILIVILIYVYLIKINL